MNTAVVVKGRAVIYDADWQPIWDSESPNGIPLADILTAEPQPCTVTWPNGRRWSGRIGLSGAGVRYESDLEYLEKAQVWPPPFDDVALAMNAIRDGYAAIGEAAVSIWNVMQPIVEAVETGKRKRPPFWAVDVTRGHRPKRIGNQPARQGRR
ncbi:hypothetical protein C1M55_28260 [Rhodococcus qingshengii]|uniref:hypothetical protein n=1 Tax=Rhodococcus qingshengii TaxID=334542 RepID=UPI000C9FCD1F|nr:hypothetical protein [Rhodococcus qingshengii]AUS34625.1 hypothetical protein C1M55_28260 [Rhodococcus qingshengii]